MLARLGSMHLKLEFMHNFHQCLVGDLSKCRVADCLDQMIYGTEVLRASTWWTFTLNTTLQSVFTVVQSASDPSYLTDLPINSSIMCYHIDGNFSCKMNFTISYDSQSATHLEDGLLLMPSGSSLSAAAVSF